MVITFNNLLTTRDKCFKTRWEYIPADLQFHVWPFWRLKDSLKSFQCVILCSKPGEGHPPLLRFFHWLRTCPCILAREGAPGQSQSIFEQPEIKSWTTDVENRRASGKRPGLTLRSDPNHHIERSYLWKAAGSPVSRRMLSHAALWNLNLEVIYPE